MTNLALYKTGSLETLYSIENALWYGNRYYGSNIGDSGIESNPNTFSEKWTNATPVVNASVSLLASSTKPPENVLFVDTPKYPLEPHRFTATSMIASPDKLLIWKNDLSASPTYRIITQKNLLNDYALNATLDNYALTTRKLDDFGTPDDNTDLNASTGYHGLCPKLDGNAANFLNGQGAFSAGGIVVQVECTITGAVATGTGLITLDDSIPQITEGDEYMTLAFTPTNASNKLKIDVVWTGSSSATGTWKILGLFQDATANALAVAWDYEYIANGGGQILLSHYMTAGTTSETTFRVRVGGHSATTLTFNGYLGNRKFGGKLNSSITITEIAV